MRIYAACLASYNNGILFGEWIEASNDADAMSEAIAAMLSQSPMPDAEEAAIHDYDGIPSSFGEYPALEDIAAFVELAEVIEDMGLPHEIASELYDNEGSVRYAQERLESYMGCAESEIAWAYQYIEDTGLLAGIPEEVSRYFDYESWVRDAQYDGLAFLRSGGKVYAFNG